MDAAWNRWCPAGPDASSPGAGLVLALTGLKRSRMRNMELIRDPDVLARARAAFDLCETAEQMMRQNLRRRHPQASEEEIRQRFRAWLEKRPYVPETEGTGPR